jgi:phage shock protein E
MRRLALVVAAFAVAFLAQAANPLSVEPKIVNERIAWADRSLVLLDVRTPAEYAEGHLPGSINIPHTELASRVAELSDSRDRDIVVYCRTGRRTELALGVLKDAGFKRIFHLQGDYQRWSEEKRPVTRTQ